MAIKVDERSAEVDELSEDFQLIADLLGGTKAMRAAASRYLPKRSLEEPADYQARLQHGTLYPAFKETVTKMTGRVFQEEMIFSNGDETDVDWIVGSDEDDADEEGCVCDDIDNQGRTAQVFARDLFRTGFSYGLTHVFVDSPPAVKEDGTPITSMKDQEESPQVRPYAIHIHPRRILGWIQSEQGKLIQLRMTGKRVIREDFGESVVEQIWVYDVVGGKVSWRKFEKQIDGTWSVVETVTLDIDHIPLVTFYANRTGFMCAEPPLLELAYLNVKHYSKQSDLDELMHVATVPILVEYGGNADSNIVIGRSAVKMPARPEAELSFCEHTGASIKTGQEDLENLKQEMRDAGAKLLQRGQVLTNAKTATQVNEEAAADNSILGAMVQDYEDFWDAVLAEFAAWRDQPSGGTVECQPNLDPDMSPIDSLKLLLDFALGAKLSDETLYEELQKRGLVNPDRSWKDELARIKSQPENQLPAPTAKPMPPSGVPSIPNAGDA